MESLRMIKIINHCLKPLDKCYSTVLVGILFTIFLLSQPVSAAEVSRFTSNGISVDFLFDDGTSTATLAVYQGASSHWLVYHASTCTGPENMRSCNGMFLYGYVPSADLVGDFRSVVLNTTGAELIGEQFPYTCDTTTNQCSFSPGTPIVGAPLSVTWTKTSEFTVRRSGSSESDYINYKLIQNGNSAYHSASATGFINGNPVSAMGTIGTSRQLSIYVQKNLR